MSYVVSYSNQMPKQVSLGHIQVWLLGKKS